jgi:hypothetical protein
VSRRQPDLVRIVLGSSELTCLACSERIQVNPQGSGLERWRELIRLADDFAVWHRHPEQKKRTPAACDSRGA